jgi:16S rRNA G966 N2-methylase RsmD
MTPRSRITASKRRHRPVRALTRGVIHGDCRTVLRSLPSESADLVLTDPPYGVGYVATRAATRPGHPWRVPMLGDK